MRRLVAATLVFAVVISTGCRIDGEHDLQVVISEVEGVLHVEIPSRAASEAPQWSLREIYNTSTDEPGLELFRVTAARFLEDGSLTIANSGSQELLQLDPRGAVRHRFGRAGTGPGEFSMMAALDVDRSGNLMVYDPRALRLTRVSPTGELVATERLSPDDAVVDLHPLSELADGRIMIVFGAVREFGRNEETRDTVPLVIVDPSEGSWDTLAVWPAQEWANVAFPQGVSARAEVGFGRRLAYAGRGGRVLLGSTDSLDLTVFDDSGHVSMRIIGWGADVEVGAAHVEQWHSELLDQWSGAPEELRSWLPDAPHRRTYPAFQDLLLDDQGRVWIGMSPGVGGSQDWLVVGDDGRLRGQLSVSDGSTLLDVAGQRVAMLQRTAFDEEYVVVMEIHKEQ